MSDNFARSEALLTKPSEVPSAALTSDLSSVTVVAVPPSTAMSKLTLLPDVLRSRPLAKFVSNVEAEVPEAAVPPCEDAGGIGAGIEQRTSAEMSTSIVLI